MNGITHKQAQKYLRLELDGLLTDDQRRDLETHLSGCEACRLEAQAFSTAEVKASNRLSGEVAALICVAFAAMARSRICEMTILSKNPKTSTAATPPSALIPKLIRFDMMILRVCTRTVAITLFEGPS